MSEQAGEMDMTQVQVEIRDLRRLLEDPLLLAQLLSQRLQVMNAEGLLGR